MKQSTKLLSLLLALVMAFSCMTVVGSALKADVTINALQYDSVDDAIISAEQGATIILNYRSPLHAYFCIGVLKIWR